MRAQRYMLAIGPATSQTWDSQQKSQMFGLHYPAVGNPSFCPPNSQQVPEPSIFK